MYIVYMYPFLLYFSCCGEILCPKICKKKNHKESTGKVDKHKMKMFHYSRRKRVNEIRVAYVILNR